MNFAYYFSTKEALQAGIVDELTSADQLMEVAKTRAQDALKLDAAAHTSSKLRMREKLLQDIANDIERDCEGWRAA